MEPEAQNLLTLREALRIVENRFGEQLQFFKPWVEKNDPQGMLHMADFFVAHYNECYIPNKVREIILTRAGYDKGVIYCFEAHRAVLAQSVDDLDVAETISEWGDVINVCLDLIRDPEAHALSQVQKMLTYPRSKAIELALFCLTCRLALSIASIHELTCYDEKRWTEYAHKLKAVDDKLNVIMERLGLSSIDPGSIGARPYDR